jgi:hypothetical protein
MIWTAPTQAFAGGRGPIRIARPVGIGSGHPAGRERPGRHGVFLQLPAAARRLAGHASCRWIRPTRIPPSRSSPAIGLAALTDRARAGQVRRVVADHGHAVRLAAGQARALSHPLGCPRRRRPAGDPAGGQAPVRRRNGDRVAPADRGAGRRGRSAVGLETSLVIATTGDWPRPAVRLERYHRSAIGNALGLSDATANRVLRADEPRRDPGLPAPGLAPADRAGGVRRAEPRSGAAGRPHDPGRARAIAEKYGCGALLPFQLGEDKLVFSPPDSDGLVVYGLAGRTAVVLGDLIGSGRDGPKRLCRDFLDAMPQARSRADRLSGQLRPAERRWWGRASGSSRWARRP